MEGLCASREAAETVPNWLRSPDRGVLISTRRSATDALILRLHVNSPSAGVKRVKRLLSGPWLRGADMVWAGRV